MKIAIIHGNDGSDVRLGKTCRSLSNLGHDVYFIGWDRRPGLDKEINLGKTNTNIISYGTKHGRFTFCGQLKFWKFIVKKLFQIKPKVVCCVNEDLSLFVLPLKFILYRYFVCDVYDALADRHSSKNWGIKIILRIVSFLVRCFSNRLIATDAARYNRFGIFKPKTMIVENVPEDPGDKLQLNFPKNSLKIYVSGSLSQGRGIENILEVANKIDDLEIICAGWPYYDFAKEVFLKHPKVEYKGIVTQEKSLQLASECDAILCFYSPTSINNIYASPNKIYDAMSVGRPVLINSETLVSKWVIEHKTGYVCDYDDIEKLKELVLSLREKRTDLSTFSKNSRELFLKEHNWKVMEKRLKLLYKSFDN